MIGRHLGHPQPDDVHARERGGKPLVLARGLVGEGADRSHVMTGGGEPGQELAAHDGHAVPRRRQRPDVEDAERPGYRSDGRARVKRCDWLFTYTSIPVMSARASAAPSSRYSTSHGRSSQMSRCASQ